MADTITLQPLSLSTDGKVWFYFNTLLGTDEFASEAARLELIDSLNTLPGVKLKPRSLNTYASAPLRGLATGGGVDALLATMGDVFRRIGDD